MEAGVFLCTRYDTMFSLGLFLLLSDADPRISSPCSYSPLAGRVGRLSHLSSLFANLEAEKGRLATLPEPPPQRYNAEDGDIEDRKGVVKREFFRRAPPEVQDGTPSAVFPC